MICWNGMGATSFYDSRIAMILAFPRVWLVMILWVIFLLALNHRALKLSPSLVFSGVATIALLGATAFFENRRSVADVCDGATRWDIPDGESVYFASDRHRGYRFTTIYRASVDAR